MKNMNIRTLAPFLLCGALFATSCGDGPGHEVIVDVTTDLVPVIEFIEIRAELSRAAPGEPLERFDRVPVLVERMNGVGGIVSELRVGRLTGIEAGNWWLYVTLYNANGGEVVSRPTILDLSGDGTTGVTVLLTRDCVGVMCPAPGGNPALLACLAGECVDPRCSPQSPEFCPPPDCTTNDECEAVVACSTPRCEDNICFVSSLADMCGGEEWCHPEVGCLPLDGMITPDGGMGCVRTECLTDNPCELGLTSCDDPTLCEAAGNQIMGTPCPDGTCDGSGNCVTM